jgi:5-epi-alpha-selinene synthase
MKNLVLPDLYCPFPSQINQHVDVLEKHALEWVLRFNLLKDELSYQRFRQAKFYWLAASAYPNCQLEELKIANDWLSWVFIWDDQCDVSDLRTKPEVLKDFHKRFIEILYGAELVPDDIPPSHALSNLRQRILQRTTDQCFFNFVHSFEDYFDGCVQEAINREKGFIPDIDSYILLRRSSVGVKPALALVEICNQLEIPNFLREDNIFREITLKTINIIAWSNDIFSFAREMENGEVQNLVFLLHYQHQIPIEKAINLAKEVHDNEVLELLHLEAFLPHFEKDLDAEVAKYIAGLNTWISASLNWYYHSNRYDSLEILELLAS